MDDNRDTRQSSKLKQPDLQIPISDKGISGVNNPNSKHSQLIKAPNYGMNEISKDQQQSLIRYNHITYLLYVLSYFTAGILWIVPIIMNYAKRQDANNSWLATHFDWQIKTFWYSIIMGVIGTVIVLFGLGGLGVGVFADSSNMAIGSTALVVLGGFICLFALIWHIYRIVKGWIALADNRPVQ